LFYLYSGSLPRPVAIIFYCAFGVVKEVRETRPLPACGGADKRGVAVAKRSWRHATDRRELNISMVWH
jgi:hypothetical protein